MAKKPTAPVVPVPPLQEQESRWQCATCRGYLAFSLPIDVTAMAQLLKVFSRAHERCAPVPGPAAASPAPAAPTDGNAGVEAAGPAASAEPLTGAMSFDPEGPAARAWARREVLLALPREHTLAERRELSRLEKQLTTAGVLSLSATF